VDRVSKFRRIKKVDSQHAEVVAQATIILLQPDLDKTLTLTAALVHKLPISEVLPIEKSSNGEQPCPSQRSEPEKNRKSKPNTG
jgi:hypothetical protein